jgi:tetratricopeptide (TPR) repeat protein
MEHPSGFRDRTTSGWIAFAVMLATLAFLPRAAGEFAWDDVYLVQNNPWLYRWAGLRTVFTMDLWGQATGRSSQLFHPIPVVSLWLQGCLHGANIIGFRIGNFLLHLLAIFLLHRLLRRLRFSQATAFLAAAVALLHPSVTEPVMWITGRHDTVGAVFLLLALLAWPRWNGPFPRAILAGACAGLAFLSKEQFIVAPFVLVAFACIEARVDGAGVPWRRLPLAFAGLPLALLWRGQLGIALGSEQLSHGTLDLLRNYTAIVQHYAGQILGMQNGATFAPFLPSGPLATGVTLVIVAALLAIAAVAFWRQPARFAAPLLGLSWFVLSLLPYLAAVPAIGFFGNRYAYVPLLGLTVAGAGLSATVLGKLPPPKRIIRLLAWVALPFALAASTSMSAATWASDRTLYKADVDRQPTNGFAQYHLGYAIMRREGCAAALSYFQAATYYAPTYERGWHNLAGCMVNLGRADQAMVPARRALALDGGNASNHYNLAAALWNTGHHDEAKAELEAALRLDPNHAPSRKLLGP